MTPTRRGKIAIFVFVLLALSGIGVAALALSGHAPGPIQAAFDHVAGTSHSPTPPPACPLTGRPAPSGAIPVRPALAIKVENAPEARPQTGLDKADIVFEEPVEGGLTRFIAVYQCADANRVGPVRSGRLEDPDVLRQFGSPVMGFAGGANPVKKAIDRSSVIDENYLVASQAYTRDSSRPAPHNLYTTTKALWKAGRKDAKGAWSAPKPLFSYASEISQKSRRIGTVHLPFSGYSDVYWHWSAKSSVWLRSHGDVPHTLTDGSQVSAMNVVVMVVKVKSGSIIDAAGNPSPVVSLTGSGRAYIFRGGRMIVGRWTRASLSDVTAFTAKDGSTIALAPGNTWVELLPAAIPVDASR